MSRLAKKLATLATKKEDTWSPQEVLGTFIYIPGFPLIYQAKSIDEGYYDNTSELVDNLKPSKTLEQLIKRMLKAKRNNEKQSG